MDWECIRKFLDIVYVRKISAYTSVNRIICSFYVLNFAHIGSIGKTATSWNSSLFYFLKNFNKFNYIIIRKE